MKYDLKILTIVLLSIPHYEVDHLFSLMKQLNLQN